MRVYINKIVCKFLFLHDLSSWHYSARKPSHDYWIKTPFGLSEKERSALTVWREISVGFYKEKDDFMLDYYFSKKLEKNDRVTIDNIFKVFEKRFEFHYKKQMPNMVRVTAYIRKLKNPTLLQKTRKLYGIKNQDMPVYIAMSYNANKSAGGMQLGNKVILQFGDYQLSADNSPILNVLFHELTHAGSVSKFLPKNLDAKLPNTFTGSNVEFIDEVIHKALWSEVGLFSQEQFGWSDREIKNSYEFLLKNYGSPNREMIKKAFVARGHLAEELANNPGFKFNRESTRKLLRAIGL